MPPLPLTTIGFDADDTLWHNERFFRLTQDRFAELLADHAPRGDLDAALLAAERPVAQEVPRRARPVRSLRSIEHAAPDRDVAIRTAYATGGYTLRQIGDHFGLHYSVVSRIARGDRLLRAKNKT